MKKNTSKCKRFEDRKKKKTEAAKQLLIYTKGVYVAHHITVNAVSLRVGKLILTKEY